MARGVKKLIERRPVDRRAVNAHKRRMLDDVRAYRLRELREAAELTQVELAARLDISQNRVSRIEGGDLERSQIDTLRRYVEALGGTLHIEVEYAGERIEIA
jgi:predicted transcriptional regulator